jgi:hypothetical protein
MTSNIGTLIDELGVLKAKIAELEAIETLLKDQLIAAGPGAYEGDFYRATVSESERNTLDMKAVRAKLSSQFITANTKTTPVTTVKVVARNGLKLAA